ncbi:hypothetical protein DIS24_g12263 [Lasiodiplodia hormozganensis]|uniref:Aminoglycoside phosphotransferase domain-containing protein n=1 Tax=Lasiodiplodia hormozganensis TaxID=869390 RepID=A0AA39TGD8_9PEZI|nr:hypothetical protein DIS24_g12263 [Lasiodiplodia hormozganensis]
MFPIKSVVDFGIPFVTTDNVSSCDPFNMQKLAILRNRRKRPNLGDSSTSLSKRRNTSNADLLPSAESNAPMTAGPSSASTPALLSNPTAIQSTATVIHTPAANASTRSVAVGPSTPPSTSSPSPKLNFFQKFTRKASRTFKKNRPAARAGNNDSSSSSSSSSSGDDAMTADTSVEPTPTRGGALRSSTIPEVAITPTSDSSRSASPAASIRTVFRVNPYTGRPAQQYDIDFLSPRTAAAAAKARRNRARSPRPIPAGRRGGFAFAASTPPASGSFPPTRTPTTVVASSSLPAAFPTRSSSLRHSNEFPFSASAADLRADDSDLYHNGSGPSTPVKDAHKAEVPASSPTLPGSAGSNYSLNKPLPGLPQEEAELPLSPAPSASDDVFYDASPVSTTSSATIGGSSSPKTPEQAVSVATASRISLTGFPTPPTTGHHHQQAFMHRLPPTHVTQPVPSNSPAFGFSSPVLPEVGGDCYTIPPTPTPARATLATVVSGGGRVIEQQSPTYRLFPHQVDNRVLEARLNQIRATAGGGGVDNADGEGEDENAGNSSAEAEAVNEDSFMLNADSDEDGDMEPLISSSPLQCNRESFTSVLTQTTGMSFVTAAEDVEMEDVEVDEEEMMNDSSLVDVDGSTLVAEGAAELSSDHQMLLSRSSTPDVENVGSDDSYVHVGDSTLDGTTLVADVEPEPSFVANMNVDEEEAEPEPATFQIVNKDGADTGVAVQVHAADSASTDESEDSLMEVDDAEEEDVAAANLVEWLENIDDTSDVLPPPRIPDITDIDNLPFRVSITGPPVLSTELQKGVIRHEFVPPTNEWSPHLQREPDVDIIQSMIKPYVFLCSLPNDDITVEFLAEGMYNKVYTVEATNPETGETTECIFRCALPDFPWYRIQTEVSTMELVRHHTTIPVPKIYAFDSSMKNALGLEWMLMEKIQGQTLCDAKETMSFESKVELHKTVADWVDQLSRITFDKMGSIYHDWSKPLSDISSYKVGPMVYDDFNYDMRLDFPIKRGPFSSIHAFYRARLDFNLAEALDPRMKKRAEYWSPRHEVDAAFSDRQSIRHCYQLEMNRRATQEKDEREAKLKYMGGAVRPKPDIPPNDGGRYARAKAAAGPEDEDLEECSNPLYDLEALAAMPSYCMRLQNILPLLFDDQSFAPQSCALHHPDMHDENILVDEAGNVAALIDWEKSFATPVRQISRYPKLIITDDDDDLPTEPEPWTWDEPKDEYRLEQECQWQSHLDDVHLRETFDARLELLASPFLTPRAKRDDDDSPEDLLNYRIWHMAKYCVEKDEVLENWEKLDRERFMDS